MKGGLIILITAIMILSAMHGCFESNTINVKVYNDGPYGIKVAVKVIFESGLIWGHDEYWIDGGDDRTFHTGFEKDNIDKTEVNSPVEIRVLVISNDITMNSADYDLRRWNKENPIKVHITGIAIDFE